MGTSKNELVDDSETESYKAAAKESDTEAEADDGGPPPPKESCPYSEEGKVLAFHSLQVYEARVRKFEYRLKEWRYFLQYLGWNKNWDEWVIRSQSMKYTDANVQKYVTNSSKHDSEKNARPDRPALVKAVPRGRKREIGTSMKEKGALSSGKLQVKLPHVPNVDDITKKYLSYRMKKDGSNRITSEDVKLPELLLHANIKEGTLAEPHQKLTEFPKFLQKNQSTFFMSTYHSPEDSVTSKNCPVG